MEDRWIRRQDRQEALPADQAGQEDGVGIAAETPRGTGSARRAIPELLSSLEAVLRTEHQVLLERDPGALTTLARQKMALLASIEHSSGSLEPAAARAWLEEDHATVAALARCRGLNRINGTLLALRRAEVEHGLGALGMSLPETEPADFPVAAPGVTEVRDDPEQGSAISQEGAVPSSQNARSAEPASPRRNVQHLA